jgi:hypothetical protein
MTIEFSDKNMAEETGPVPRPVLDVDVARLVADAIAIPFESASDDAADHHHHIDVFAAAPRANMMIVVEDAELPAAAAASAVRVRSMQLPGASSVAATMATLTTGATPSMHGIVGDSWFTRMGENKRVAYSSENEYPLRASVADIVAMLNQQKASVPSVVVSASSSSTLSRALGARPSLKSADTAIVANLEWDAQVGAFIPSTSPLSLDYATVIKTIRERFPSHTVQSDDAHTALYAEVAAMFKVIAHLASVERAHPMRPVTDYIAFGIHGLSLVKSQSSANYAAALELVQSAIQSAVTEYRAVYGADDASLYQIIRVNLNGVERASEREKTIMQKVHNTMAVFTNQYRGEAHLTRSFPHIFLRPAAPNTDSERRTVEVCEALRQVVDVYCPPASEALAHRVAQAKLVRAAAAVTAETTTEQDLSFEYISMFHIILWSTIFVVAAIIAIIYAFATANDGDKDTLLYRTTAIKHVKNA